MANILVVEDDNEIRELICLNLRKSQYTVDEAESGEIALQKIKKFHFDLLILDWMLPGLDGVEITKALKAKAVISPNSDTPPILMITAKSEPEDIVNGLDAGADDYVTKPFDLSVLKARVKALLRRSSVSGELETSELIRLGDLTINKKSHEVVNGGDILQLTLSEFKLLLALASHQGRVLTRERLIGEIQGDGVAVIDRTVDTHVFGLRKKLGVCSDLIETIRGIGYRVVYK